MILKKQFSLWTRQNLTFECAIFYFEALQIGKRFPRKLLGIIFRFTSNLFASFQGTLQIEPACEPNMPLSLTKTCCILIYTALIKWVYLTSLKVQHLFVYVSLSVLIHLQIVIICTMSSKQLSEEAKLNWRTWSLHAFSCLKHF